MDSFQTQFKNSSTPTSHKATSMWWSVTGYNTEIKKLQMQPWPTFVKRVYGGPEICPDTGREHFQGAIQCYQSVRMSQFKEWLPTAHLEKARSKEALIKYAMKAETAVGEKTVQENHFPHLSADQICMLIARQTDRQTPDFWTAVRKILADEPRFAGQLMNPSLRNFYERTQAVWINRVIYSITNHSQCKHGEACIGCTECTPII